MRKGQTFHPIRVRSHRVPRARFEACRLRPRPPSRPTPRRCCGAAATSGCSILAALLGVPVSAAAYGFLALADWLQEALFTDLPKTLGFDSAPVWWPLPLLALVGAARRARDPAPARHRRALAGRRLPGVGAGAARRAPGHLLRRPRHARPRGRPRSRGAADPDGQRARRARRPPGVARRAAESGRGDGGHRQLRGDQLAARLAADRRVPAAGGLRPRRPDARPRARAGPAGRRHRHADLPRAGLAHRARHVQLRDPRACRRSTTSRARSSATPSRSGWSRPSSAAASRCSRSRCARASSRAWCSSCRCSGWLIAGLAIGFGEATDKPATEVLFSGQSALPGLVSHASEWSVGALLLLVVCKSVAYALSLSSFRGGPVFPAMFIGAAGGDRRVAPAGAGHRPRRGDGHRRDVHRDAVAAADVDDAGHAAARRRRPAGDAGGDRRGGGRLRRHRAPHPAGSLRSASATGTRGHRRSRR